MSTTLKYTEVLAKSEHPARQSAAALLERHPDLGLMVALELGTKVATGEMAWG